MPIFIAIVAALAGAFLLFVVSTDHGRASGRTERPALPARMAVALGAAGVALLGGAAALAASQLLAAKHVPGAHRVVVTQDPRVVEDSAAALSFVDTLTKTDGTPVDTLPEDYVDPNWVNGGEFEYVPEWKGMFGRSVLTWNASGLPMRATIDADGLTATALVTTTDAHGRPQSMREDLEIGGGYGDEDIYFAGVRPRDARTGAALPDSVAVNFYFGDAPHHQRSYSHAGRYTEVRYPVQARRIR